MKRGIVVCLVISVFVALIIMFFLLPYLPKVAEVYMHFFPNDCKVTKETITVSQEYTSIANDRQYCASVRLFAWKNKLYFYPYAQFVLDRTAYFRRLCVFENSSASFVTAQLDGRLLGMRNGCFYYEMYSGGDGMVPEKTHIYCYNATTNQTVLLFECNAMLDQDDLYFSDAGRIVFRTGKYRDDFYALDGMHAQKIDVFTEQFIIDDLYYVVEGNSVVSYDLAGNREVVLNVSSVSASFGVLNLLPCESGLIIHNDGAGDLLYYIPEGTHELVELLSFPCGYSESAVNIHKNRVYVSLKRYEFIPDVPYENDTISGTYCINLYDLSVEKLCSSVYNGLYIFDDTGIYACDDQCNIYKLDFDGNVITMLLEH